MRNIWVMTANTSRVPLECHQPDLGHFSLDRHLQDGDVERREHDVWPTRTIPRSDVVVFKCEPHVQLKTVCVMHTSFTILPGLLKAPVWRLVIDPALRALMALVRRSLQLVLKRCTPRLERARCAKTHAKCSIETQRCRRGGDGLRASKRPAQQGFVVH